MSHESSLMSPREREIARLRVTGLSQTDIANLMSPREREIARLRVTGLSQTDIAKRLGINRRTVMRALERDIVRGHITHLHDALDAELVRAMVYNPFVELMAQTASTRRGRRRRSL